MKRIMTATAAALILSAGAHAQDGLGPFTDMKSGQQTRLYASDLLGARIHASDSDTVGYVEGDENDWDVLGEIDDIVVNPDGSVQAVILGVGGFLGMGERKVAIEMSAINVVRDGADATDYYLVIAATREMVESAPEFTRMTEEAMAEAEQSDGEGMDEGQQPAEQAAAVTEQAAEQAAAEAEQEAESEEVAAEGGAATAGNEARPLLSPPDISREGYSEVTIGELDTEDIKGAAVLGPDDRVVGDVGSLILSEDGETIERAVINVGGFLGIGEKPVAVTFEELQLLQSDNGSDLRVYIDSSEKALKAQPEYKG